MPVRDHDHAVVLRLAGTVWPDPEVCTPLQDLGGVQDDSTLIAATGDPQPAIWNPDTGRPATTYKN